MSDSPQGLPCPLFSMISFIQVLGDNLHRLHANPSLELAVIVFVLQPLLAMGFVGILPFFWSLLCVDRWRTPPRELHKGELKELRKYFSPQSLERVKICQGSSLMARLVLSENDEAFALGEIIYFPRDTQLTWRTMRHELIHIYQFRNIGSITAFLSNYFAYSLALYLIYGLDSYTAYYGNPTENEAYTKERGGYLQSMRKCKGRALDERDVDGFDWEIVEKEAHLD
eukprot:TRINITY_DN4134_c0_g1_i2.p1 TRINITY_DN4134_c0_g1~~TRINITY_DN4134_c0_g1_i2.p1  ORF type:complete len:227 (-),score=19.28 TRINITY_DN4134_c0_g1_i2:34-714(-)